MGVIKSLKIDKKIRSLSGEQAQAIVELLKVGGASFSMLGVPVSSPQEEIRLAMGTAEMGGRDPEQFLDSLIAQASKSAPEAAPEGTAGVEGAEATFVADVPPPEASGVSDQSVAGHEAVPIRPSTLALLEAAQDRYGQTQLESTLEEAPALLRSGDLDRATQLAVGTFVQRITAGQPQEVERYCGSTLMTGYIVGRAMLGTEHSAIHYSNPLTESDNVETLVRLLTTADGKPFLNQIGDTGHLFWQFQMEMAGRAGPLAAMPEQERQTLVGGSALAGLVMAFAEHDLYVAE